MVALSAFWFQNFGKWWGPMNSTLHSMNAGRIVATLRGGGDTQTASAVIKFIWTFCRGNMDATTLLSFPLLPLHPLAPAFSAFNYIHNIDVFEGSLIQFYPLLITFVLGFNVLVTLLTCILHCHVHVRPVKIKYTWIPMEAVAVLHRQRGEELDGGEDTSWYNT